MKKNSLFSRLKKFIGEFLGLLFILIVALLFLSRTEFVEVPLRKFLERQIFQLCDVKVSIAHVDLMLPYSVKLKGVKVYLTEEKTPLEVGDISFKGSPLQLYYAQSPQVDMRIEGLSLAPEGVEAILVLHKNSALEVKDLHVQGMHYALAASFSVDLVRLSAVLSKCHFTGYGQEVALQEPVHLSLVNKKPTMSQGLFACNGENVSVECLSIKEGSLLTLRWDDVYLPSLFKISTSPFSIGKSFGKLAFTLSDQAKLSAEMEGTIKDIQVDHKDMPIVTANFSGRLIEERLNLKADIYDRENKLMTLEGNIGINMAEGRPIIEGNSLLTAQWEDVYLPALFKVSDSAFCAGKSFGKASFTLSDQAKLSGEIEGFIADIQIGHKELPPVKAHFSGRLIEERLNLKADVYDMENKLMAIEGKVGLNMAEGFPVIEGNSLLTVQWEDVSLPALFKLSDSAFCAGKSFGKASFNISDQAKLSGEIEGFIADIQIGHKDLPPVKANFSGRLLEDQVFLKTDVYDIDSKLMAIEGKLGLIMSGSFPIGLDANAPISAEAEIRADITPYCDPLLPQNLLLAGDISSKVSISGSLNAPKIFGTGALRKGYFESVSIGALFSPVDIAFTFDGQEVIISSLQAQDAFQGLITGSGKIALKEGLPFNFSLLVEKAAILHLDNMEGLFSGQVTFSGDKHKGCLKGSLVADNIEVFLPEETSASVHSVDVIYVNQNEKEAPPTKQKASVSSWPLVMDLEIKSPNTISVHGHGVTSTWKGELKISETIGAMSLSGECRIVVGDCIFNGRLWKITDGTVSFSGDPSKKISLYVVAELEIEQVVTQVIIKGPYNDLGVAFRSSPPLSQREILSLILFGRGLGEINSFQGAELSRSINKLKEAGASEPNMLTNITKKLNFFDRVNFVRGVTEGGEEEVFLQIGKYISPHLFLGGKISKKTNSIGIEASLMENVKLQAEIGKDNDQQIHLKWKRDY